MTSSAQLRDILGIADAPSAIDSAEVIRRGLSIESFKRVAGYYQLTDAQMSKVVGTSVRTIVRLQKEQKPLAWFKKSRFWVTLHSKFDHHDNDDLKYELALVIKLFGSV